MNELSRECVSHLPQTTAPFGGARKQDHWPTMARQERALEMLLAIELGLGIWGENKEEILRPAVALFTCQLPSSSCALHRGP